MRELAYLSLCERGLRRDRDRQLPLAPEPGTGRARIRVLAAETLTLLVYGGAWMRQEMGEETGVGTLGRGHVSQWDRLGRPVSRDA